MAFKEVTTTGPIEWAKVYEGNRDMVGYQGVYEACDGAYTLLQILSKEEMAKLKAAGSSKKAKQARLMDGEIAVTFERKHRVTNSKGEFIPKASGAPKVVDANDQPFTEIIGNGSIAEVTNLVTTFKLPDGTMGARTTLQKVKILEHIPYEAPQDEDAA